MADKNSTHAESREDKQQENSRSSSTWRRPRLEQLRVSLDTAGEVGSNIDGFNGSLPV